MKNLNNMSKEELIEEVKRLKKSNHLLLEKEIEITNNALDAQLDSFFVFDPKNGKALRWNKRFSEVSGYSDKEISELKAPDSYYSPEDLKKANIFIEKVKYYFFLFLMCKRISLFIVIKKPPLSSKSIIWKVSPFKNIVKIKIISSLFYKSVR